jgi:hypothetical protein
MNIGIYELSLVTLFGLIYLAIPTTALVLVILTYIKVKHIEEHLTKLK